jgi:hypothetical protein
MLCYSSAPALTCVISWTDSVLSEQVRWLMVITCPRVEYRSEGVMPITASTRAAPHSSRCICAEPDRWLTWDSNEWLPHLLSTTVAIAFAKSIWARAVEVTQNTLPSRWRDNQSSAPLSGTSRPAIHRPVWWPGRLPSLPPSNHRALPSSLGRGHAPRRSSRGRKPL